MKSLKTLAYALLGITASGILAGCQDEDFGYTSEEIRASVYKRNFEKVYGEISPDQTWDFTSYNLGQLGLLGGPTLNGNSNTRAAGDHTPIGTAGNADEIRTFTEDKYVVEQQTLNWLNTNLTEEVDHRSLGTSFNLVKPNNDFLIIPIYQGNAGLKWDLHLVAGSGDGSASGAKDYNIWSKSQNIYYTEDHTSGDGEEYFYYTMVRDTYYDNGQKKSPDGDFWGNIAEQNPTHLFLDKAFHGFDASTMTQASITFNVPSGLTIKGYFADKDDENNKLTIDGTTDFQISGKQTYDLSSLISNDELNNFQDLMFRITDAGSKTAFMHYSKPNERVRIFTKYDYKDEDRALTDQTVYATGHTINRTGVKSKAMKINHNLIASEFILYLDITFDDGGDYAVEGEKKMSNASPHMMLALTECSVDQNEIDNFVKGLSGCEYMVLGCEDTNIINKTASWGAAINSDWDYNDIVFLVVGMPTTPKIKEIYKKRYMIEDLGSTFDFDFNDIVVDVTMEKYLNADGTVDYKETNSYASIKHLCGTIPFQLKIGDKVFGKVTDPTNHEQSIQELLQSDATFTRNGVDWNPDEVNTALSHIAITGWDPKQNNISIKVWPQSKTSDGANADTDNTTDNFSEFTDLPSTDKYGAQGYTFPSNGDQPYIIAVDQTVDWMPELKSIPKHWFTTWSSDANKQYDDYNNGGGSQGQNPGGDDNLDLNNINQRDFNLTLAKLAEAGATDDNQKIRIVVTAPSGRQNWGCGKIYDLNDNEKTELKGPDGSTTWNFEFTLAQIKEWAGISGGIRVQVWDDYNVTKVEILEAEPDVDPKGNAITGTTIEEGSVTLWNNNAVTINEWDNSVTINPQVFNDNNVKANDVLIVHTSGLYESSQGALRDVNNWTKIADNTEYFDIDGDYELTITDDILAKIKNNGGLRITGKYYTITKVTLRPAQVITYTLTTSVNGNGTITISPQKDAYNSNENVTLTAVPLDIRYKFTSWGDDAIAGAQRTITMDADKSFTASFGDNDVVSITASVAGDFGGSVAVSTTESYTPGENQYYKRSTLTLTATLPEGDYRVKGWSKKIGDSDPVSLNKNTTTITEIADSDAEYIVEFEEKPAGPTSILDTPVQTEGSGNCPELSIDKSKLEAGQTLKIYFDGPWLSIFYGYWENQQNGYSEAYSPSKYKYKVLTSDDVNMIKTNGLYIQGENSTVTDVTIEY